MEDLTGMETVRIEISFRVGGLAVAFAMNYVKLIKVNAQIQHVDMFAELDLVDWEINPIFTGFCIELFDEDVERSFCSAPDADTVVNKPHPEKYSFVIAQFWCHLDEENPMKEYICDLA